MTFRIKSCKHYITEFAKRKERNDDLGPTGHRVNFDMQSIIYKLA